MAFRVHTITRYNYSFDARAGGPGRLQLWSSTGKVGDVTFIDETMPVPAPILGAGLNSVTMSFRRSSLAGLIDMLRNEDPVSLTINDQAPGFAFVHTGLEPVGEGEA
jgi:hypothetical protein